MGNHKRYTLIEIILLLAIAAILVVWLFPRFLKSLDSDTDTTGRVKSPSVVASEFMAPKKSADLFFLID